MTSHRLLILVPALWLAGCTIHTRVGPTRTDPVSVERDNAEFVRANFSMKAGKFRISGGSSKLLDGQFTYNIEAWKPVVKYVSAAGHGTLSVEQPGTSAHLGGNSNYEWDLRLTDAVPLDLNVEFGAGEGRLDMSGLQLRAVDVRIGAGRLDIDLRGAAERSYDVHVRGGVGEATIRLPRDVGVYAKAKGGIGEIRTPGLRREGDHYINDAYDRSKSTIRLDVEGGIGQINLISD